MNVEKGDIVGGFFDMDDDVGFIIGKVVEVKDDAVWGRSCLVSGMSGKSNYSGDWWVLEKDMVIHIKGVS